MRSNMTGIGFYNSEPQNNYRSFGRGAPKPSPQWRHHSSPQMPRKGDLFMEAGKLAVEYLVSRGLLSSNVLPGKYQNGSLRNNVDESYDLRSSQDKDSSSRSSVELDLRNYSRERRRLRPSRSFSSDWIRENEKEGSLTENVPPSRAAVAVENDTLNKDAIKSTDTNVQNSHPDEILAKDDKYSESEDGIGNGCSLGDSKSKVTTSAENNNDKQIALDAGNTVFEVLKNDTDNHDKEKDTTMDTLSIQQVEEKGINSPLVGSSPKGNLFLTSQENYVSEIEHASLDSNKRDSVNGSEENSSPKCLGSTISDHQQKALEPLSFSYEPNSSGLTELGMCSSIGKDRVEKRPIEEESSTDGAKKAKQQQWLTVAQSDEYLQLSDMSDGHSVSAAKNAATIFNVSVSQESFTNVSLPLKFGVQSDVNEEKQMLSNSFKICDLNLMEGPDMHDNHDASALLYPSMSDPSRNFPVDIDLSMRNSCNVTNERTDFGSLRKDIEIIDLENSSLEECKRSNDSVKNPAAGTTVMDSFQNPQNTTENPDGQDGYGSMISELLGNDVPNCSSVQPDINTFHTDISLNHGETTFSEDDPIYMSLGEIPLTGLLRGWE
ncbi:uncharacterized protein At4g26450-like isoform X1 [Amaranthus tricolor]|uniref:uncharacterized protein At4g26450-like isoform X1 n=1 Tax=Amaranthus tricolor TaxID=29722 RepID=UPI002584BFBD|nr:uncharacterized protein At4g26450-like isoform X1 [Amaranthus tricolor]